jgi:hypothetical protein
MKDLLELYRNYLFALQEREEYGDKYGDTDELIETYQKTLKLTRANPVKDPRCGPWNTYPDSARKGKRKE